MGQVPRPATFCTSFYRLPIFVGSLFRTTRNKCGRWCSEARLVYHISFTPARLRKWFTNSEHYNQWAWSLNACLPWQWFEMLAFLFYSALFSTKLSLRFMKCVWYMTEWFAFVGHTTCTASLVLLTMHETGYCCGEPESCLLFFSFLAIDAHLGKQFRNDIACEASTSFRPYLVVGRSECFMSPYYLKWPMCTMLVSYFEPAHCCVRSWSSKVNCGLCTRM